MPYVSGGMTALEHALANGATMEDLDYPTWLTNFFYSVTGQTEKTSAYQAQMEREDSAMQRLAADYEKAGLSKFGVSGTGSQTGSYGDGVPKGLQLANAIMDLKSKKVGMDATQAGIKKTLADAAYTDAMTKGQENQNRTFNEKFAADMVRSNAQAFLFQAQGRIANTEGQFSAEKITAEIGYKVEQTALLALEKAYKPLVTQSGLDLNRSQININEKQIAKMAADIAHTTAQTNHVNEQTKNVIAATAYQLLKSEIDSYNLEYSKSHGLRTSDQISRFMGVNLETADTAKESFKNWGGIFNWPSWNDLMSFFGGQH